MKQDVMALNQIHKELTKRKWTHFPSKVEVFYFSDEKVALRTIEPHLSPQFNVSAYSKEGYLLSLCYYGPTIIHFRYGDKFLIKKITLGDSGVYEQYLKFLHKCNEMVKDIDNG